MLFTFGDCSVDCDRRELRRGDKLIAVEPQVFDVLVDPNPTTRIALSAGTICWRASGVVASFRS